MSWLRRKPKLKGYFWVMVVLLRQDPFETRLVYGLTHAKPGESAMGVFNTARQQLEEKHKGLSGCPMLSFTIVPNDL